MVNEGVERLSRDPIQGHHSSPRGPDGQGGDGIICAHLLVVKAVLLIRVKDSDRSRWAWMWASFADHREKLRIIEYELSWPSRQDA
jgi:hypothetical protein